MFLKHLWLSNFRNYTECDIEFSPEGLTVVQGSNGQGKTNLLEAVGYIATLRSFRGATPETLIKSDESHTVVRGVGERDSRELLIETELRAGRRGRTLVNKQSLQKVSDLGELLAATVFSPDDLSVVKGGPALRRQFVDDLTANGDLAGAALQHDFDRVIKQRNTLLRQAGNRLTPDVEMTLDVWDVKMTSLGEQLAASREKLVEQLGPFVQHAYSDLADETGKTTVNIEVQAPWREVEGGPGLARALANSRRADLGRQVTTVGPHRDEISMTINQMPARTQASQGEQRTLTLALRLAGHRFLTEKTGSSPILLLDDVFSELDEGRARRLIAQLPPCQTMLSTATAIPSGLKPSAFVMVDHGMAMAGPADAH